VFSPLAVSDWAAKKRAVVQPVCIEIYPVRFTVLSCIVYSLSCIVSLYTFLYLPVTKITFIFALLQVNIPRRHSISSLFWN